MDGLDWALSVMEQWGYPGVALLVLLENLFPPIPSEVILPFAGFLTTRSSVTILGMVAAATLGSVLGAFALYLVGAWFGRERILWIASRYGRYLSVKPEHVFQAEGWFERYGPTAVFLCRMVPIMRSIISVPAGLIRMGLARFALYTALGTLIWNTTLVTVGALLGASWPLVSRWVGYYQDVVIVLILTGAVLILVRLLLQRFRR